MFVESFQDSFHLDIDVSTSCVLSRHLVTVLEHELSGNVKRQARHVSLSHVEAAEHVKIVGGSESGLGRLTLSIRYSDLRSVHL